MQSPASTLAIAAVAALVVWRTYARIRRWVGRQQLSNTRLWITFTLIPALVLLLAVGAWAHPERLLVMGVALVAGAGLAVVALRRTVFEATPQGFFYTPNAHIGIVLSLLFIARIIYRLIEIGTLDPMAFAARHPQAGDFARSPLTLAVFGLLAGYYVGYSLGLVRWRARVRAERARASVPPAPATHVPADSGSPS